MVDNQYRGGAMQNGNELKGVNQDSIQSMNRTLIMKLLREQGICSRANLAKLSGLKKATVTYIVNDFINWGCVKEVGLIQGNKGRRSIGITLAEDRYFVIGIRLARRDFKVGLFSINGNLIDITQQQIESGQSPERTMENILSNIDSLISRTAPDNILAIGMAIPGPFIKREGKIAVLTETAGWGNMAFREELEKRYSFPVFIEHDANAGAYAQIWYDKLIDKNASLIYVAIGQGVGAGIVYNGEILKGELGIAGEIGHTSINFDGPKCECGNHGCLEKYCSSIVLARNITGAKKRTEQYGLSDIQKLIDAGDEQAIEEFRKECRYLGYGIVNAVNSFNPSAIILGDDMSHINDGIMLQEVNKILKERLLPEVYDNLNLKVSKAVKDSVLHGIGAICINEVLGNLELYLNK